MPGWSDCLTRMTTPSTDRSTSKRPTRVMKASFPFLTTPSTAIWELLFSAAENLVLAVPRATRNDVRISYRSFGASSKAVKATAFWANLTVSIGVQGCKCFALLQEERILPNVNERGGFASSRPIHHADEDCHDIRSLFRGSPDGKHFSPKALSKS